MNLMEAIKARHSVRSYSDKPIEPEKIAKLQESIRTANAESGLNIQLVTNEPRAFDSFMAHYGKFSGVTDYIAIVGKKGPKLEEASGYYGEQLVLLAQQLGLNTCWVGMTFKKIKSAFEVGPGEKLAIVISLGYGTTQGMAHKVKSIEEVSNANAGSPAWFRAGVEASLLAPTAVNQQKFFFELDGSKVSAKGGSGFFSKTDLGIVKCHFEIGAGKENFTWA